jgi:putative alpha-1,2-mannosidase
LWPDECLVYHECDGILSALPWQIRVYTIGTPVFDKITINLEDGKKFIINANRKNKDDYYIQSASLNKSTLSKSWFSHSDLTAGG